MTTPKIALSQRARRVRLSPIAAAGQRAAALVGQGRDVLALTSGEPEFDTPPAIQQAAIAAMARGETRYPPTPGTQALRRAVAERFAADHAISVAPAEVFIGSGGKQVIFNAFAATLDAVTKSSCRRPIGHRFRTLCASMTATPSSCPATSRAVSS